MIFKKKGKHDDNLYNILLNLARNKFFYKNLGLPDTFETRVYLMFFHFSIILNIYKKRNEKFDQTKYDFLFNSIEYDLRELGFGDVAVNTKMKNLNKILYDILLKIEQNYSKPKFKVNSQLILKYFDNLIDDKEQKLTVFCKYFELFFDYCFDISSKNMLKEVINFKN